MNGSQIQQGLGVEDAATPCATPAAVCRTSVYDVLLARAAVSQRRGTAGLGLPAGQHCCVPRCTSDSRYPKKDKPIWFHAIPKDKMLRKSWIIKSRREEGPNFKVCFVNSCK